MLCGGNEVFFDATNPDAKTYVWEKIKKNYYDQGATLFWLDVAEPQYSVYDFKNYRYQRGSVQAVSYTHLDVYKRQGQINATELAASLICSEKTIPEGIRHLQDVVDGSMTLLLLTKDGIYAARDKKGRTRSEEHTSELQSQR